MKQLILVAALTFQRFNESLGASANFVCGPEPYFSFPGSSFIAASARSCMASGATLSRLAYRCTNCSGNKLCILDFFAQRCRIHRRHRVVRAFAPPDDWIAQNDRAGRSGRLQIGCKTRNNSSNSASQRGPARSGPIISAFGISPKPPRSFRIRPSRGPCLA